MNQHQLPSGGGRNVWHYSAHNPNLKAGVAFYGPLADKSDAALKSSIELAPEIKEPVLGLYGGADSGISADQVHQMEAVLKPTARPPNSTSTQAHHTVLSPITGRAIARRPLTTPGIEWSAGSKSTKY
jgi:dienelactone hydrolase